MEHWTAPDLSVVLELARTHAPQDPYAFRFEPQTYALRTDGGGHEQVEIDWTPELLADLESLQRPDRDPVVVQRLGETLARFFQPASWSSRAQALARAHDAGRRVVITIRSSAAELYSLPWELITLPGRGQHLGELPGLLLRYERPDTHTAPEPSSPRPAGGRILLAWSAAAGAVPAAGHEAALRRACARAHPEGLGALEVLPHASVAAIAEALARAERAHRPFAVLHVLCHGGRTGQTSGLVLDGESGPVTVGANAWRTIVAPHASSLQLVLLAACEGGNAGQPGNHLGSVAQALHAVGLRAVVASRLALSQGGSITLAEALYEGLLGAHESLEQALLRARARLALDPRHLDWAALQLHARVEDGTDTRPFAFRPYRGLRAFGPKDAVFCAGRAAERHRATSALQTLARAGRPRLLVLCGASGAGKTSLARAGVVPDLLGTAEARWALALVEPGPNPLGVLEAALASVGGPAGMAEPDRPWLVVVDPFEQVLTHAHEQVQAFVQRVRSLACDERGSACILVLRSQHARRCHELLRLDDERHWIEVAPISASRLATAITEPARRVGLTLQPGLLERIKAEVEDEPGALPLVQQVLDRLWHERRGHELCLDVYERLGGVVGAFLPHASATLVALGEPEHGHARRMLTELVRLGDDGACDARRRVPIEQMWPGDPRERETAEAVLDRLIDARVVVASEHSEGGATVELAHGALVRCWPLLVEWLAHERGRRIGRYRVLEPVPEHVQGRALLAYEQGLDRHVLLRLFEPEQAGDESQGPLRDRARALARLSHPNVQSIYDVGTARGCVYMALERLEGESLTAWIERAPRSSHELTAVMLSIMSALEAVHELGLVHGRVGPDAVWIDGRGAPRLVGSSPRLDPEASPARDVHDACALLHRLLHGEPPPAHDAVASVPPRSGRDPSARSLREVLLWGLALDPAQRGPSMAALRTELRRALEAAGEHETRTAAIDREQPAAGAAEIRLERPGGVVSSSSAFYVSRPELETPCLREIVEPGGLLRIKGPQRMGKTTLMTRVLERPRCEGWRIALIDLQLFDHRSLSDLDRFLQGLCAMITRRLKLPRVEGFWDDVFGPKDNCTAFFEQHLLEAGPLVLAFNHVDRLFDSQEIADEFLALLRAWHEMARSQPLWQELRMVLVYSTEMYLPMSINHSPFNVGLAVPMEDWDARIILELARRHGLRWTEHEVGELMALLGGHPHLVRIALYEVAERGLEPSRALESAASDEGPFGEHLKKLLWRLQGEPSLHEAAAAVMKASGAVRLSTELAFKLVSLGVARLQGNEVVPGRELYRRYLCERLLLPSSPPAPVPRS
ncbi:AAA-like domain-containing protein [Paraliomyxa miuraensis]|uniref:AAA-like domain-containing protein n=1 Tax=Paraliomyxa miuraensis TaxID=376150 RepID=UPI002258C571|nr:AAA-like domain-containing protein [Paraliomyxa miuraensis]MCX4243983.1 AAA-like domain-containing protein [Paraliomyxa miuraensis]